MTELLDFRESRKVTILDKPTAIDPTLLVIIGAPAPE